MLGESRKEHWVLEPTWAINCLGIDLNLVTIQNHVRWRAKTTNAFWETVNLYFAKKP